MGADKLLVEHDVSFGETLDRDTLIMSEIDRYLRSQTNANIEDGLKDSPIVRKMFLKFNCVRSSEAMCERMFSYAGNLMIQFKKNRVICR